MGEKTLGSSLPVRPNAARIPKRKLKQVHLQLKPQSFWSSQRKFRFSPDSSIFFHQTGAEAYYPTSLTAKIKLDFPYRQLIRQKAFVTSGKFQVKPNGMQVLLSDPKVYTREQPTAFMFTSCQHKQRNTGDQNKDSKAKISRVPLHFQAA